MPKTHPQRPFVYCQPVTNAKPVDFVKNIRKFHAKNCNCNERIGLFSSNDKEMPVISKQTNVTSKQLTLLSQLIGSAKLTQDPISTSNFDGSHTTSEAIKLITNYLNGNVNDINKITIQTIENNGKDSLIISWGELKKNSSRLIYNGHMDVVPPDYEEQCKLHFNDEGNVVFGRGTLDMHGLNVAVLDSFIHSVNSYAPPKGGLILQIVSDEENGGDNGTKYIYENRYQNGIEELINDSSENLYIVEGGGYSKKVGNEHRILVGVGEKGVSQYQLKLSGRKITSHYNYRRFKIPCESSAHAGIMLIDQNPIVTKVADLAKYATDNGLPISEVSSSETSKSKIANEVHLDIGFNENEDYEKHVTYIKETYGCNDESTQSDIMVPELDFAPALSSLSKLKTFYNELDYDWLKYLNKTLKGIGKDPLSFLFYNEIIAKITLPIMDFLKPTLLRLGSFGMLDQDKIIETYQNITAITKANVNPVSITTELNNILTVSMNIRTTISTNTGTIISTLKKLIDDDLIIHPENKDIEVFREATENELTEKIESLFIKSINHQLPENETATFCPFILPGSTDGGILRSYDKKSVVYSGGFLSHTTTEDVKNSFHTPKEYLDLRSIESYQTFFTNLTFEYLNLSSNTLNEPIKSKSETSLEKMKVE